MDISKSDGGGCVQCHIKIQNIAWDDIAAKPQLKKAKPTEIWNQLQEREACLQNNVSFVNKTVTPADEHAAASERSAVTYRIPKAKPKFIKEPLLMKLCLSTRMIPPEVSTQSPTAERLSRMGLCKSLLRLMAYTSRHTSPKLQIIWRPIDATKKLKPHKPKKISDKTHTQFCRLYLQMSKPSTDTT